MIQQEQINKVREIVREHYPEYEEKFGVGPCGILAEILNERGWGQLAFCHSNAPELAHDKYKWYPHYVVVSNGEIVDVCGEYLFSANAAPIYRELELLNSPKDIEPLWSRKDKAFWMDKLAGTLEQGRA